MSTTRANGWVESAAVPEDSLRLKPVLTEQRLHDTTRANGWVQSVAEPKDCKHQVLCHGSLAHLGQLRTAARTLVRIGFSRLRRPCGRFLLCPALWLAAPQILMSTDPCRRTCLHASAVLLMRQGCHCYVQMTTTCVSYHYIYRTGMTCYIAYE